MLVELLADKFALAFSLTGSGRQMFVNAVRIISLSFIIAEFVTFLVALVLMKKIKIKRCV